MNKKHEYEIENLVIGCDEEPLHINIENNKNREELIIGLVDSNYAVIANDSEVIAFRVSE